MIDHWATRLTYISAKAILRGNWRRLVWCKQCIVVHRSANLQIQLSWGMLKLEFKRTCMKQISLPMIEPSRADTSELIIYLLQSFLLFQNKEFSVSRAGS
eukprot:scaffold3983_cov145-Skeletonema_dohrnii-CCMP3373.AAC.1